MRLRFCAPCYKQNIQRGAAFAILYDKHISNLSIVYTLLPRETFRYEHYAETSRLTSKNNYNKHFYYTPELQKVANRYFSLLSSQPALDRFIEARQKRASEMMQNGLALQMWDATRRRDKYTQNIIVAHSRSDKIEANLLAIGWHQDDFPSWFDYEYHEWRKMFDQPRELTPRIWHQIRPKLEATLERIKPRKLADRIAQRRAEFDLLWESLLRSIDLNDHDQNQTLMPNASDAAELPAVRAMIYEDDCRLPVTAERWASVVDTALTEAADFMNAVKDDFLVLMNSTDVPTERLNSDERDYTLLHTPAAFFTYQGKLFRFDALFRSVSRFNKWCSVVPSISYNPLVPKVVDQVLKALYLPADTPIDFLKTFDGFFMCCCRNLAFGLTFSSLIEHIVNKIDLFSAWSSTLSDSARGYNEHELDSIPSLVCAYHQSMDTHSPEFKYCIPCQDMAKYHVFYNSSPEEVEYHLNTEHHLDPDPSLTADLWSVVFDSHRQSYEERVATRG